MIASDRPPHELSGLEDRLVSRFRWGLCVDVQPPDLETRIAILQLKAERENIPAVPPEVIEFVASKFDQSVRELEGALVRVVAWSELTRQPIDIELAERALQDLIPQTEHEIPPPLILEETATYFQLSTGDLVSKSRSRPLTQARHIAMYLMRECTGLSLVKIGEIFGGRDHTTALHGIKKVEDEMRSRDDTFRQVQDLTRIIRGRVRGWCDAGGQPRRRRADRGPRIGAGQSDRLLPPSVHMSDRPSTLGEARVMHIPTAPTTASSRRRTEEAGGSSMKFRCDRDDLSEALQTVQRGVSSRPGIPALTGCSSRQPRTGRSPSRPRTSRSPRG